MDRAEGAIEVYIGLGANVGPRLRTLQAAVHMMTVWSETHLVASPVYETEAHLLPASGRQPDHLNAVVGMRTPLDALDLMDRLRALEQAAGRDHEAPPWSPRPLDLDLLLYGDHHVDTGELVIPHPRLPERRFVLEPLADLAPDLVVPGIDATVSALLARSSDASRIERTDFALLPPDSRDV